MRIELGRYYTSNKISQFLVSQMETDKAQSILDLGCGIKRLSKAASNRWNKAEIFTIDIDDIPSDDFLIKNNKHIISDALHFDLPKTLGLSEGVIDIAVCNPPFVKPIWRDEYMDIVNSIGIDKYFSITYCYNSEILFLAQIIRMLKSGGEAGVILPDTIFSSKRFRLFRQYLIAEHDIKKIIELPSRIFNKTEAKTHILIFNKERKNSSSNPIELRRLSESGELSAPIFIDEIIGTERLDYSYHEVKINSNNSDISLGSIIKINRGRLNSKEIRNLEKPTIHITDIQSFDCKYRLSGNKEVLSLNDSRYVIVEPGDILMSRVGRNFHKKIVLVTEGYAIASDCLFIIKCSSKYRQNLFKFLTSPRGQEYLIALSYGVTVKQISMEMVKNIRWDIDDEK